MKKSKIQKEIEILNNQIDDIRDEISNLKAQKMIITSRLKAAQLNLVWLINTRTSLEEKQ